MPGGEGDLIMIGSLMLPTLLLIVPFAIVFRIRKVRWYFLRSIILCLICAVLECTLTFLLFIINPFVIIAVIIYVEALKVESPLKTSSILAIACGFAHAVWLYFALIMSESHAYTGPRMLICIIPAFVIAGAIGGAVYCVINFILHSPWRIYKEAKKDYREVNN